MKTPIARAGYVAIVGRPNVGKSTLLNVLLGEKVSITSPKPQTTRWQILGIKTREHEQIVYIDTPGMHSHEKHAMNRYMNRIAHAVLFDADAIVFVIDATDWREEDQLVVDKLKGCDKPIILAINKIDLVKDKAILLPFIETLKNKLPFAAIVPLSAMKRDNIAELEDGIAALLPEGEWLYPEDQLTDKSIRFLLAEIIREKLIYATEEELPYATAVEIEHLQDKAKCIDISAVIWVERVGQKVIVIGKGGAQLKKIGTQARREMQALLGKKVFLRLWVKVKENWTDDDKALRGLGYS